MSESCRSPGNRQANPEGRPLADLRVEADVAAVLLLDDPPHQGQSLPGPLTDFFRREERLEDPRPRRFGDAGSRVADRNDDVLALEAGLDGNGSPTGCTLDRVGD